MKKIIVSLIILFINFSCEIPKPPVEINNLIVEVTEDIKVSANILFNVKEETEKSKYEYGFIYEINSNTDNINDIKVNKGLNEVEAVLNLNSTFSYVFDDLFILDYISSITIRGYVKIKETKVLYTKDTLTFNVYEEAQKSNTNYAKSIVNIFNNVVSNNELSFSFNVDEENEGFEALAFFKEFNESNIYGILYKYNSPYNEQEDLNFKSSSYNIFYSDKLVDNELSLLFSNIKEDSYYDDITFRSFIYNKEEERFILCDNTVTITLYDLALEDSSDFSNDVVSYVESTLIIIEEIFINTDVTKEYEIGSYSSGIEVKMFYDYLIVRLTVTTKKGYRFSSSLTNENITILRVDDNIIISDFKLEVSANTIIIEYDDYGWGPPM